MPAPRIGLLVTAGITLDEVSPIRDRLELLGAHVTIVVPTGGAILPVSGRYYPAAGGPGSRKALCQASPADFDLLLLPDDVTGDQLASYPLALRLIRGMTNDGVLPPVPVCSIRYLTQLLNRGVWLEGLIRPRELSLSGSARGR